MKKKQKRQVRKEPEMARSRKAAKSTTRTKDLAYDAVNKATSTRTHPSPIVKGRAKRKPVEERVLR